MDKSDMRRYDHSDRDTHDTEKHQREHNDVPPVPELQGHAKLTKEKAKPIKYDGKRPNTTP